MQWHWGNIGSAAAGLAVFASVAYALITGQGPAWLRENCQRAREQAALARTQRKQIELDRERVLYGWAGAGGSGEVYEVALVTDPAQVAEAVAELSRGDAPTRYVIQRVAESTDPFDNAERARSLRQLIDISGYLSRAPEAGEYEALRNAAIELAARRQQEREEGRARTARAVT